MQLSEYFEKLVLSVILSRVPEQDTLAAELRSSTVESRDYTGVGLYTKLVVEPSIFRLEHSGRDIEEIPKVHLTLAQLLSAGGGAMLWLSKKVGWSRSSATVPTTAIGSPDETQFSVCR